MRASLVLSKAKQPVNVRKRSGFFSTKFIATALFMTLISTQVTASLITWEFEQSFDNITGGDDCSLIDCGGASGWFEWDTESERVSDWFIQTYGGEEAQHTEHFVGLTYDTDSGSVGYGRLGFIMFNHDDNDIYFRIRVQDSNYDALSNPDSNAELVAMSECYNCSPARWSNGVTLYAATSIDAPSGVSLFLLGAGLLLLLRRKA